MSKKATLKKLCATGISVTLLGSALGISADAASYSRLIDNDPTSSSGNSSYASGFSYMSSGSCYNGDARISPSSSSGNFYNWIHPQISLGGAKTVTVNLQVYLNHANFTDPRAAYSVYKNGDSFNVQTINQNTAAGGWNTIRNTGSNFTGLWIVSVEPSGQPNCQTGADAVNVTYTY